MILWYNIIFCIQHVQQGLSHLYLHHTIATPFGLKNQYFCNYKKNQKQKKTKNKLVFPVFPTQMKLLVLLLVMAVATEWQMSEAQTTAVSKY